MSEQTTEQHSGFKPPSARRTEQHAANAACRPTSYENAINEFLTPEEFRRVSEATGYRDLDEFRCDHIVQELLDCYESTRFTCIEAILSRLVQTPVNTSSILAIGGSQLAMTVTSISQLYTQGDNRLFVRLATLLILSWNLWINSAMNSFNPLMPEASSPPTSPTLRARAR